MHIPSPSASQTLWVRDRFYEREKKNINAMYKQKTFQSLRMAIYRKKRSTVSNKPKSDAKTFAVGTVRKGLRGDRKYKVVMVRRSDGTKYKRWSKVAKVEKTKKRVTKNRVTKKKSVAKK